MSDQDFEKNTLAAQERLNAALAVPMENRDFSWEHELYQILPFCYFEILGQMTDPSERPYAAVKPVQDIHIRQICQPRQNQRPILPGQEMEICGADALVYYCMERRAGIAIVTDIEKGYPDAMIRLGSVWSYYEYKDFSGCGNVVSDFERASQISPENPFDAIIQDTDRITIGAPSDAFFPQYVRDWMVEEIRSNLPDVEIEFGLLNEHRYAMPTSIQLGISQVITDELLVDMKKHLSWYMPPYLPLSSK